MRINFLVNRITGGWEPTDTRLGGTEESVVQWAKELAKRGHNVRVYYNKRTVGHEPPFVSPEEGSIFWEPREKYFIEGASEASVDINIKDSTVLPRINRPMWKSDLAFISEVQSPDIPMLYLTNETDATSKDLSNYVGVIWPSQWAVDNIPVNNKTFILPHGYDPEKIYPDKKISKQCLYTSSPDRGLDTLLKVWPEVYKAHPDATLVVTYGAEPQDIPGVTFLGECDEETMNELYRTSDIWAYPCNGGELYCMSGIKAQAAGCIPVYNNIMALTETVKVGYPVGAGDQDFAQTLITALNQPEVREEMRKMATTSSFIHYPTWKDSTDKLLEIINSVLH